MFQTVIIQKGFYSDRSLYQKIIIPKAVLLFRKAVFWYFNFWNNDLSEYGLFGKKTIRNNDFRNKKL